MTALRPRLCPRSLALLTAAVVGTTLAASAAAVSAATVCDPAGDTCVVVPDTVQTPAGAVTVTVGAGNVVTVRLAPSAPNTLVLGVPFAIPPGPPCFTRTVVSTAVGPVDIDTKGLPPGPPCRSGVPNLAVISIHPPGPCFVRISGDVVVFTPIFPPGPPT